MTTIAWDGEVLAGDRQSTSGNTPTETTKVFKIDRAGKSFLVGACGNKADCESWYRFARGESERPAQFADEMSIICIDGDRRIWIAHKGLDWYEIEAKNWAIGSGGDYALGAMGAYVGAKQAILIATKLDVHTGFGVDVVTF